MLFSHKTTPPNSNVIYCETIPQAGEMRRDESTHDTINKGLTETRDRGESKFMHAQQGQRTLRIVNEGVEMNEGMN